MEPQTEYKELNLGLFFDFSILCDFSAQHWFENSR